MTHARGTLAANTLLAGVAAVTAWVSMWAWRGLAVDSGSYLNPLLLLAAVIAATGVAGRWWRWPSPVVFGAQLLISGMLTSLILCGSPLPVGSAWTELHGVISDAVSSANDYPAPVPTQAAPVAPLLILGGLAFLLLVDLLACTMHRVPLAGLPLLAIYSIPVGMVGDAVSWLVFAATAAGYLTMLFLQESDHVSRWGRPLVLDRETGDPVAFGAGSHAIRGTAGLIGGAATALAIMVPVLVPATGIHLFDIGPGSGGGDQIRIDNPVADLVRDLKRGENIPLIEVTTNDPDPSYLRILTLNRFTDAEWSPGDRDVPVDHQAQGQLPPPAGVASQVGRSEHPYSVTVLPEFDSRWLPTQPPISRIDAAGDWRYDDKTMDFLAGDDDLSTAGLRYTMTAVDLDLTSERLAASGTPTGKVDEMFTELPDDVPAIVGDLADQVTEGATTQYEKAVALQNWFRDDGNFEYSLDRVEGNGSDALVDFLTEGPGGRVGYCEQFASAMAVMARELGIPARVAIGFLNPTSTGRDSWVYRAHDMHAWPELFFDGSGWVRFEPTPAARDTVAPAYTVPGGPGDEGPSASASVRPRDSASAPIRGPRETQSSAAAAGAGNGSGSGPAWAPVLGGLAAIAIVVLGALLPRSLRRRRRERRFTAGVPEEIWAELHDTAIDLGVAWPPGRSPRARRDELVGHLGAPAGPASVDRPSHGPSVAPDAVSALDRIVRTLELHRYAREGAQVDPVRLRADGELCVASLAGGATRSARRRAEWWPRTVVRVTRRRRRASTTLLEAKYGGVIDRVN